MFRVHAKFMTWGLYGLHTSAHLSRGRVGEGVVSGEGGAGGLNGARPEEQEGKEASCRLLFVILKMFKARRR